MPESADLSAREQTDPLKTRALFAGLIYNELGESATVANIGGVDHYAIVDQGFRRHVEAHRVDDLVLAELQRQLSDVQPQLVEAMLDMLGRRDIFTKAALDSSLANLADSVRRGDASQWATMLGLAGFRVIVDHHGNVVEVVFPATTTEDDD